MLVPGPANRNAWGSVQELLGSWVGLAGMPEYRSMRAEKRDSGILGVPCRSWLSVPL